MKHTLIRMLVIFLLGHVVYFNYYIEDELGLAAFFAHIYLVGFTLIISIPIIFIKNQASVSKKIGLVMLSLVIAFITPSLGIGKLKYMLQDELSAREINTISKQYDVNLTTNSIAIPFEHALLVDQGDGVLTVYDEGGQEVNKVDIKQLAKDAISNLPLTEKQRLTTYYDGYESQRFRYELFTKEEENNISFSYRYVTDEIPDGFTPAPDMPSDATNIQFHYDIIYTPSLNKNGEFLFEQKNYKKDADYRVSYKATGMEAIVAPANAKLINEM